MRLVGYCENKLQSYKLKLDGRQEITTLIRTVGSARVSMMHLASDLGVRQPVQVVELVRRPSRCERVVDCFVPDSIKCALQVSKQVQHDEVARLRPPLCQLGARPVDSILVS